MSNPALSTDALMEQAIAHHRAGQLAHAEEGYRTVLKDKPDHARAHHNLGVMLVQDRRLEEGLSHLERALQLGGTDERYALSYARGLWMAGRMAEAVAALAPDAALLDRFGSSLLAQGHGDGAIHFFKEAIAADPDFADGHYHLGSVLSENGEVAEGFHHFMRRAALVYGRGKRPASDEPDPPYRQKHDQAQRDFLWPGQGDAPQIPDIFRLTEAERLTGPAVNPANATPALVQAWRQADPQFVVIDNFLMPQALEKLRAYAAGSTVWRKNYAAGYLGAAPEDGFAPPLLAQIVEDIQSLFQPILGEEAFRYLGAFKYDSELCAGTNIHADNSTINVNFYIAPDEANLDPASGGMRIWNVGPPDLATMRRLNADEAAVHAFLEKAGAEATVIPHRANRAVIFKSTLFHKTDAFSFKPDYLSRRINVSLLFGTFR